MSDENSHVARLAAKGHQLPTVVVDCAGKNLNDLFFETKRVDDGLEVVDGPLTQAHREGRPIHLANFDLAELGTDNVLGAVLQVFGGEIESHKVVGPKGSEHTFDKGSGNFSFSVSFSSPDQRKGKLSISPYSRLAFDSSLVTDGPPAGAVERLEAKSSNPSKGQGIG